MHVVLVKKSPKGRKAGPGAQYGWGVPRGCVAWFRNRKDVQHSTQEIGFDDGSWVRIFFPVGGWGTLAQALAYSPRTGNPVRPGRPRR